MPIGRSYRHGGRITGPTYVIRGITSIIRVPNSVSVQHFVVTSSRFGIVSGPERHQKKMRTRYEQQQSRLFDSLYCSGSVPSSKTVKPLIRTCSLMSRSMPYVAGSSTYDCAAEMCAAYSVISIGLKVIVFVIQPCRSFSTNLYSYAITRLRISTPLLYLLFLRILAMSSTLVLGVFSEKDIPPERRSEIYPHLTIRVLLRIIRLIITNRLISRPIRPSWNVNACCGVSAPWAPILQ